jgi:hypothetical protein
MGLGVMPRASSQHRMCPAAAEKPEREMVSGELHYENCKFRNRKLLKIK